ncbi:histidine triad nucleotide-binding protein [Candidatus Gottesmanbacteria bacterium RBG_13_37_7]|uniref:Histidine triad nucleotide-binding protein n=1 Tax=Candidatus Gottesmanbacteria bacterium RBG_13_37_7 TaxID=1798369 RepID=A0A1F5YG73_9BACT|nr:MAG: histidine triad nucleotide-binding protein [Candidatus Gottesmanbacteria bacterium RBG_13_37_7]
MSECLFCKIIKGEITAKIIYQDRENIAIYDIKPKSPVHVLVMPKKHITSLQEIDESDVEILGKVLVFVQKVASKLGIAQKGYKVVINNGAGSGQEIFHLHLHILGGWQKSTNWQV